MSIEKLRKIKTRLELIKEIIEERELERDNENGLSVKIEDYIELSDKFCDDEIEIKNVVNISCYNRGIK